VPARRSQNDGDRPVVAGVALSHAARLIFPGVTKEDLARYYVEIERWIVPHVRGRALTLLHCPNGAGGPCTFLRHTRAWGPTALRRVRIPEKTKVGEYLVADDISGIVALAQMGIVEIHTWNADVGDVERPNRLVWDLDPGPEVTWTQTIAAARLLREVLETLGLAAWVKTTGGRGLHIVVPILPARDWSECLDFSREVSGAIVRSNPALFTIKFSKQGRERKILLDYLRNNRTNTSICAYSPRARKGAPVSMPVDWSELRAPQKIWTLASVRKRLAEMRVDPWAGYWKAKQRISPRAFAALSKL
jgi:bifunctional non-homologous end joining protein LigD